ncbi:MAG TPA: SRPBCC family protein [Gaiellaceae bacterium]|nr:SRPBCC family protein [Gaiellaceae bacterium]
MLRIDVTLEIARPPAEVFAALTDLDRIPEWQESALESRCDGPLREGARIFERRRAMGRELENELEVTRLEPGRRLTVEAVDGPVPFTVDHQLVEEDGGGSTFLHVIAEGNPGSFMKLAKPMLKRHAERELRGDFARLKEQLERR